MNRKTEDELAYEHMHDREEKDEVIEGLRESLQETHAYIEIAIKEKGKMIKGLEDSLAETKLYLKMIESKKDEIIDGLKGSLDENKKYYDIRKKNTKE